MAAIGTLESQVAWCSQALQKGPLVREAEQEFAKTLLDELSDLRGQAIHIRRMSFRDVDLSQQHQGPDAGARPALPDEPETQDMDLLSQLLEGPSRGRGRARGRGGRTSSQLRKAFASSLPFDQPSESELQAELATFLQEEHLLPPEPATTSDPRQRLERAVEDPVAVASMDPSFGESVLDAVGICRTADEGCEAVFSESDDNEVVGESDDVKHGDESEEAVQEVVEEGPPSTEVSSAGAGIPDSGHATLCGSSIRCRLGRQSGSDLHEIEKLVDVVRFYYCMVD